MPLTLYWFVYSYVLRARKPNSKQERARRRRDHGGGGGGARHSNIGTCGRHEAKCGQNELCPTPARTRRARVPSNSCVHVLHDASWNTRAIRMVNSRPALQQQSGRADQQSRHAGRGVNKRRRGRALTRAHRCATSPVRELMLCNASLITLSLVRVHQWPEASVAARRGAARRQRGVICDLRALK